jgi:hypothetical protein
LFQAQEELESLRARLAQSDADAAARAADTQRMRAVSAGLAEEVAALRAAKVELESRLAREREQWQQQLAQAQSQAPPARSLLPPAAAQHRAAAFAATPPSPSAQSSPAGLTPHRVPSQPALTVPCSPNSHLLSCSPVVCFVPSVSFGGLLTRHSCVARHPAVAHVAGGGRDRRPTLAAVVHAGRRRYVPVPLAIALASHAFNLFLSFWNDHLVVLAHRRCAAEVMALDVGSADADAEPMSLFFSIHASAAARSAYKSEIVRCKVGGVFALTCACR